MTADEGRKTTRSDYPELVKCVCSVLLTALWLVTSSPAATLTTAKVVSVKKYERGRIAYWEGTVPVYDDNPVYDITLLVDKKEYVVRYESLTGYYPSAWQAGQEPRVRRERGRFILMNRGEEVPARIVGKDDCDPSPHPRGRSVPVLPCP